MITPSALIALLIAAGLGPLPQAQAITHYAYQESRLDPCAKSHTGESLLGVTRGLRRDLHAFAGTPGCVSPEVQIRYLAVRWPLLYPECEQRFRRGDLSAFKRCWGQGHRR